MTAKPQLHSQFVVSSNCLAYGSLHNIWHGASSGLQEFPVTVNCRTGGTVASQVLGFNIIAQNGIWNAFQLVEKGTNHVRAWFVAHSEVDPEAEIDKILRVSGSPYEPDSGSSLNDHKTAAEGVLVINRYDWGYYDDRSKNDIASSDVADDVAAPDTPEVFEAAGLVDLKCAKTAVLSWQEKKSHERSNPPGGVWMHIPDSEYMFGRFGFDQARTAARSFLFFTTSTIFTRTTLAGLDRTLRLYETDEERFQRYLREGRNFDGLDSLRLLISVWDPLPAESDYLGPYEDHEYLLRGSDIDAIRTQSALTAKEFADPWRGSCETLLNEMILSYLEHFVAPASSCGSVVALATSLFPKHAESKTLDGWMYTFMTKPHISPTRGYDIEAVGSRIKRFLTPRCETNGLVRDAQFIDGVRACIAFLLSETLELANNNASGNGRSKLVPADIRVPVYIDHDLRDFFKYSNVFWKGSGQEC